MTKLKNQQSPLVHENKPEFMIIRYLISFHCLLFKKEHGISETVSLPILR